MGFFSRLFSSIGSFAKRAWEATKQVAATALGWLADKAEGFVKGVKNVLGTVKEKIIRPALEWAREAAPWPWLKSAISSFENILSNFGDSALGRELKAAIEWTIKAAQNLRNTVLSVAELGAARLRQALFGEAAEGLTEEQRTALDRARTINSFVIIQTTISHVLESGEIDDFEHYLRLRAAQKLLKMAEVTLSNAEVMGEVTEDDMFLLEVANELLEPEPQIEGMLERLDLLVENRLDRKGLVPFVFEEMVVAWDQRQVEMKCEFTKRTQELTLAKDSLADLEVDLELGRVLTEAQEQELSRLRVLVESEPRAIKELDQSRRELAYYVDASKGFLSVLEERESRQFVLDKVGQVGMLIIQLAELGRRWDSLTEEEQQLIVDFANMFSMVEVGVS